MPSQVFCALVAALLLPACASRTDPLGGGTGGASAAACEACAPARYTCHAPETESLTLFIESRDATGCEGPMSPWRVRIGCEPLQWCFEGGDCQSLARDADGTLDVVGTDGSCFPYPPPDAGQ